MQLDNKRWMLCINLIGALKESEASSNVLLFNVSNTTVKVFKADTNKQLSMIIPIVKSDGLDRTGIYVIRLDQISKYIEAINSQGIGFNAIESSIIFNGDGTVSIKTKFRHTDKKIKTITRKLYYTLANMKHIQTRGIVIQANNMEHRINEYQKKSDVDIWGADELYDTLKKFTSLSTSYKDVYISSYSNMASSVYNGYVMEIPLHKTINNTLILSHNIVDMICSASRVIGEYLNTLDATNEATNQEPDESDLDRLYSVDSFEENVKYSSEGQNNQIELLKPFDTTDVILKTFDNAVAIQFKQSESTVETTSIINNLTMGKIYIAYAIISKEQLLKDVSIIGSTEAILKLHPNFKSKEKAAYIEISSSKDNVGRSSIPTLHFYEDSYRVFGYYIKVNTNALKDVIESIESEYITFDIGINKICIGDTDISVLKDIKNNNWPLQVSLIDRRSDIQTKRAYLTCSKV